MEISVNVDEKTLTLIKDYFKKDVDSVVNEALSNWTKERVLHCPLDGKDCMRAEPCNSCSKVAAE